MMKRLNVYMPTASYILTLTYLMLDLGEIYWLYLYKMLWNKVSNLYCTSYTKMHTVSLIL